MYGTSVAPGAAWYKTVSYVGSPQPSSLPMSFERWPDLPLNAWRDTYETLHRWTQIIGKIRLAQTPWVNHSWHVPLYVTARGLTTSLIPHGNGAFQISFDFVSHQLLVETEAGATHVMLLKPKSVADFYHEVMRALHDLRLPVRIYAKPNELPDATPFAEDETHAAYDPDYAHRLWRVLLGSEQVLQKFRARFVGKVSPVHFFWGSFDLALTRFSGRPAPPHPGGIPHLPEWVVRDAYSHEVISCGFWPGGDPHPFPQFYSYAYPEPKGFAAAEVQPAAAFYSQRLREFVLPYDAVRQADQPEAVLLSFLQTTYEAAASLGGWDRMALERKHDPIPSP